MTDPDRCGIIIAACICQVLVKLCLGRATLQLRHRLGTVTYYSPLIYLHMKTDTSINIMLIVFCIILIGFVILNGRMNAEQQKMQAAYENKAQQP